MLLAGVATSYLVPGPMVRREIVALADEVTGAHWRERETILRMSAVSARAEQAARGEKVEYRGRLVDPRYRFRTSTIVEALDITESEMRACGFRHLVSPEMRREHHRAGGEQRRRMAGTVSRQEYETNLDPAASSRGWPRASAARSWYRRRETSACRCMVAKPPVSCSVLQRRSRPGGCNLMGGSGKGRRDGRPTIEGCASRPLASCMNEPPISMASTCLRS